MRGDIVYERKEASGLCLDYTILFSEANVDCFRLLHLDIYWCIQWSLYVCGSLW